MPGRGRRVRRPITSICGGEPLVYAEIEKLVESLVLRHKHVYLCTNGVLLTKSSPASAPAAACLSTYISTAWRRRTTGGWGGGGVCGGRQRDHGRPGRRLSSLHEHDRLPRHRHARDRRALRYLEELGVDGLMISPAFSYAAVREWIRTPRSGSS